jgi:hypothetical protein
MRIARSLMLGVAGSVLTAGAAMAADPMPIVVSTVPAITVPVPGREVAIDVEAGVGLGAGDGLFLVAGMGGTIDVTSATGWGMRFEGSHFTFLEPPFFGGAGGGTLTLYRAFGDLELGVWAGAGFGYPPFGFGGGAGLSANYEHEGPRLYVSSESSLLLFPFIDFDSYTELEFDLNDRFTLSSYFNFNLGNSNGGVGVDVHATDRIEFWANLYYNVGGLDEIEFGGEVKITDRLSVWTEAGFDFGPPQFEFDWIDFGTTLELTDTLKIESVLSFDSPFVFDYAEVWAELDRPIGTGPLSVIAALGVGYDGGGPYAWGNIGLRYKLGGPEDRDDNRLFGDGS